MFDVYKRIKLLQYLPQNLQCFISSCYEVWKKYKFCDFILVHLIIFSLLDHMHVYRWNLEHVSNIQKSDSLSKLWTVSVIGARQRLYFVLKFKTCCFRASPTKQWLSESVTGTGKLVPFTVITGFYLGHSTCTLILENYSMRLWYNDAFVL